MCTIPGLTSIRARQGRGPDSRCSWTAADLDWLAAHEAASWVAETAAALAAAAGSLPRRDWTPTVLAFGLVVPLPECGLGLEDHFELHVGQGDVRVWVLPERVTRASAVDAPPAEGASVGMLLLVASGS
jgi:hypothetical protein